VPVETTRAGRGPRVAYLVVLLGAAAFVASCFLPYYEVGLGGRDESVSMYQQLQVGSEEWTLDLGTFLLLFGALAVLGAIAIVGLVGRGDPLWNPAMLAVVALAWSLTSFGTLLRATALLESPLPSELSLAAGFWVQAASVLVVVLGTMALLVTARRAATREPLSSASP
jgi:hypothetical protein